MIQLKHMFIPGCKKIVSAAAAAAAAATDIDDIVMEIGAPGLARISHRLGHNSNFDQAARLQPDEVV